jgi:hypothetical protein
VQVGPCVVQVGLKELGTVSSGDLTLAGSIQLGSELGDLVG